MPVLLLFLQASYVRNERVDFLVRKLFPVSRHLAFAVHDGIKNSFVAYLVLPLGIAQVARMVESAFRGFAASISAVTRSAVF